MASPNENTASKEPQKADCNPRLVQRLRMLLARWICYHMGCDGGWYEPCKRCGKPIPPNY